MLSVFGPDGRPMVPTFTRRKQKAYRYCVALAALKNADDTLAIRRVPAGEIERAVMDQVRVLLRAPELVVRTARAAKGRGVDVTVDEVRSALADLDPLWNELFPAEQSRIVRLLVERVDVAPNGLTLRLRTAGITAMVDDLRGARPDGRAT